MQSVLPGRLRPTPRSIFALPLLAVLALAGSARADQFIVADETYTHSGATTSDSHYRVAPRAGTPKDWTKPVNYAKGSAHVLLEVKTKPGDTPTKFQICFEGSPTYACTDQSPTYTKTGKYEWTTPFSRFYQGNNMQMNWANGVSKVALILKDTQNNKPQGDPKYVPTDLHVEVAIISEGEEYVSPGAGGGADAGSKPDAGSDAGSKDAGPTLDAGEQEEQRDAGLVSSPKDAAVSPRRDASTRPSVDAGVEDDDADTTSGSDPASAKSDSGCQLAGGNSAGAGWLLASLLGLAIRRRRQG